MDSKENLHSRFHTDNYIESFVCRHYCDDDAKYNLEEIFTRKSLHSHIIIAYISLYVTARILFCNINIEKYFI